MRNAARAGSLPFVIGLLVAVVPRPGLTASVAEALPYSLVLSPRPTSSASPGTVIGQFGGVPVGGTFSGTASSGTLTLTVKGMTFVTGSYLCSTSRCALTGTVAGQRGAAVTMSGLGGIGQATSSLFPNRETWVSVVSGWATTNLGNDDVPSIVAGAASIKMVQTSNEKGQGSGRSGESGGGGGGGGGGKGGY